MNKLLNKPLLLSLLGGSLLSLAWWEYCSGLIIFIALLPFLQILKLYKEKPGNASRLFLTLFTGFLLFNILSFSWLGKVSIAGASLALLTHSTLLALIFHLAWSISMKAGKTSYYISIISLWLAYEFACLNIDIISPWLNSGNVFGKEPMLVQWYEYTGTAGGSLWIILVNILIFNSLRKIGKAVFMIRRLILPLLVIIIPITSSILIAVNNDNNGPKRIKVLILQPNIDPYNEKFDSIPFTIQFESMIKMAETSLNKDIDWLVFPETAIDDPFPESDGTESIYIQKACSLLSKYASLNIILGATTIKYKKTTEEKTANELYNTAIHVHDNCQVDYYHKSKLVPGIENNISILPGFIERILIPDLGGSMSGYTSQSERFVFKHSQGAGCLAPIICYESAYGEFCSEFVRQGADILAVITNDGWWDNSPAYKQHLWFASLRAIENRRPLIRSANTGISCYINTLGKIEKQSEWWKEAILYAELAPVNRLTFYSKHGDYLYRIFTVAAIVILVLAFVASPIRNLNTHKKI